MKAIVQMVHQKLMGSVIDAIEYFLIANLYNKDVYLVFFDWYFHEVSNYKKRIISIIENKYILNNQDYQKNILVLRPLQFLKTRLDLCVIIDWGSIPKLKGFINSKQVFVISELTIPLLFLNKEKYNVTYFGEMPFVYKDVDYRMKMAFDLYPKLNNVQEGIYVNSPENDYKSISLLNYIKTITNKPVINKSYTHKNNLFECFDEYLYYHANKYFDPHPRLFQECFFYNKKIHYVNDFGIKDGSFYRYQDLQTNGLKDRFLTKDDEVIRELIK